MDKRKREQYADDNASLSHKKPRVVWTPHLHAKFLDAVNFLGLHEAVPRKIAALMNVEGITKEHVASHLQKYRLSKKKANDKVSSRMILEPTQSQTYFNIHPQSYNFPVNQTSPLLLPNIKHVVHQSHTETYSNMSGVGVAPSTPIQSQNINIHPPPSTYPIYHDTSTLFPSPLGFPTPAKPVVHQSNMSGIGVAPSTLIQSQNINIHPPPSTYPIYHHTPTLFPSPLGFPTPANSSKSTSIWDYHWHITEPHSLLFPHSSLPVLESHNTNQNTQMSSQQTEPIIVESTSLEDTNIMDYNFYDDIGSIDFSVEETDSITLKDLANMSRNVEEEDLMNAWRCFEEKEDFTNVMQPLCYETF
ncbi:unnamed protein product [Lathyrus sativus]|nr:unnamed protein product [Lathyrus sativus]